MYPGQDPSYLSTCPRTIQDELAMTQSLEDIYLSPLLADTETLRLFPRTVIIASDLDPCLDENVEFSSKLHTAGVDVKVETCCCKIYGSFIVLSNVNIMDSR